MSAERYMVDDAGTVIDKVTRDNFELAYELVSILNNYASTLEELVDENEQLRKDNKRLRMKIESLNENFNRLNKLFNEVEDVDEELMMEYMRIVGRTIDD